MNFGDIGGFVIFLVFVIFCLALYICVGWNMIVWGLVAALVVGFLVGKSYGK